MLRAADIRNQLQRHVRYRIPGMSSDDAVAGGKFTDIGHASPKPLTGVLK